MLVDTQKPVAPERFRINSTNFAHSPLVTMKKTLLLNNIRNMLFFVHIDT